MMRKIIQLITLKVWLQSLIFPLTFSHFSFVMI